jgi:hypothetical protein
MASLHVLDRIRCLFFFVDPLILSRHRLYPVVRDNNTISFPIPLIDRWSSKLRRPVTADELAQISANILGFFDTLSAWHQADTFESSVNVAA